MLGKAGSALQLAGNVASIVNLGATVAFGVATLRKLGKMEEKQDLGFSLMFVEFHKLAEGQARIEGQIDQKFHEQVLDKLSSARRDMETTLDDQHRGPLLAAVLGRTSEAYESLLRDVSTRTRAVAESFRNKTVGRAKLALTESDLLAMQRFRLLASAAGQRARVLAEAGRPDEAAQFLRTETEHMREVLLRPVGEACFQGERLWDELLQHYWPSVGITPARLGIWAERFDPDTGSLAGIIAQLQASAATATPYGMTHLREGDWGWGGGYNGTKADGESLPISQLLGKDGIKLRWGRHDFLLDGTTQSQLVRILSEAATPHRTHIDSNVLWTEEQKKNVPAFFDLLDGAWEDIDRLEGHAVEYWEMARRGLRVAEYGQRLRVDSVPDGVRVVFMTDDDELDEEEPQAGRRIRAPGARHE